MIEQDTVKLLRECDAGLRMGMSSIDQVLDKVRSQPMKASLENSRRAHDRLESECTDQLHRCGDSGKAPSPVAEGMSWVKTNVKLAFDGDDACIAELMTDGCSMGIKSLSRYLNQYPAADSRSRELTRRVIGLEKELAQEMQSYL